MSDSVVEEVELPDGLLQILHVLLCSPDSSGDGPVRVYHAVLQPTPQPLGAPLVHRDALLEASDLVLDLLDCEHPGTVPERDHLFVAPVSLSQGQTRVVGEHWGRTHDVGRSQSQDFGAVAARDEQAEGALIPGLLPGLLQGRYGDAEGGREWVVELGEVPVEIGVESRELRSGTGEERLKFPYGYFDVVKSSVGENVELDVLSNGLRVLEGHLLGLDADRHHQGAEGILHFYIGEGEWHGGGEWQVNLVNV